MRIFCPNCDAEYEVDASLVPPEGRDVQCSNCGQVWFQENPTVALEKAAESELYDPPSPQIASPPPEAFDEDLEFADEPTPPPGANAPPRPVEEAVFAVLREEAARENQQRKMDRTTVETQPDLGLQRPDPAVTPPNNAPADSVETRVARLRGQPQASLPPPQKRDMFPPIAEINSSLRSSQEKREGPAAPVTDGLPAKTGGFVKGFALGLIMVTLLLALYLFAPGLGAMVPALDPVLQAYVSFVDAIRLRLHFVFGQLVSLIAGAGA